MQKQSFKKQLMTSVAAAALVIPMILGGFSTVHAQSATSASQPTVTATNPTNSAAKSTTSTSNNNSSTNQSAKPNAAAQANMRKQIMAMLAKKQKAQEAEMMKKSTPIFAVQGKEVYTLRVIVGKKNQATPLMDTKKKYMSLKRFIKTDRYHLQKAQAMLLQSRKIASKQARNIQIKQAKALLLKYERIVRLPTQKQMAQEAKQKAKQAKATNKSKKENRKQKSNKKYNKKKRTTRKRARRNHRRSKRVIRRRSRAGYHKSRIRRQGRSVRKNKRRNKQRTTFTVKVGNRNFTYLKSEYQRGNQKRAHRTGFAQGPTLDAVPTLFDHYQPNNRRAVIPKGYKIIPDDTTWLVGRHTNNVNRITHMRQAYYYNQQHHGWSNIGYQSTTNNKN